MGQIGKPANAPAEARTPATAPSSGGTGGWLSATPENIPPFPFGVFSSERPNARGTMLPAVRFQSAILM